MTVGRGHACSSHSLPIATALNIAFELILDKAESSDMAGSQGEVLNECLGGNVLLGPLNP